MTVHPIDSAETLSFRAGRKRCSFLKVENKINPGQPNSENLFKISDERRKELGIEFLPKSLISAISALEKDSLMEEVLGEHTYANFIENKRLEYAEYHREVHDWEIKKYIPSEEAIKVFLEKNEIGKREFKELEKYSREELYKTLQVIEKSMQVY